MAEEKIETKIATPKKTAVAVFDDTLLSGGTGLEETTTEDFAIPFVRVLQNGSPQVNKQKGEYVEGAEPGKLYNTVTNGLYDGTKGILVVPCAYVKKFIEWIPRDKGGGLVDASHDVSILKSCVRDEETRRFYLPDSKNEIVETAQFFILILGSEPQQAVLAFTSTQLSVARKWLTMLRMARVQNSKGESVSAPMFPYTYRLTTTSQSNEKGTWNGYSVNQQDPTELSIAKLAKEFMSAARAGEVKVKEEQQRDETVVKPEGDAPF